MARIHTQSTTHRGKLRTHRGPDGSNCAHIQRLEHLTPGGCGGQGAAFVVAGFYRTCVIDGVLEHLPAEYVRNVPPESRTLGLTHLQPEALLTAARDSLTPRLRSRLPLEHLRLRIFEETGADVEDLGENTATGSSLSTRQERQGGPRAAAAGGRPGR